MKKITNISQLDFNKTYSYADYLTWTFDDAVELIRGKITLMSPAPNVKHQRISADLNGMLYTHYISRCRFNPFNH